MSKHSTGFQSDPFSSKPCESCESKRWAVKDVCHVCGKDCCDKCATHVGGNKLICAECKESQDAERAPCYYLMIGNCVAVVLPPDAPMRHAGDFTLARGEGFVIRQAMAHASYWGTREEAEALKSAITHSTVLRRTERVVTSAEVPQRLLNGEPEQNREAKGKS